jgi:hypothetical protein
MGEVRGLCFGWLRVRIISSLSPTFSLYLGYLMIGSLGSSMMRARLRQRGWHLCIPGMPPVSWEWDLVCNKWISTLSCGLEYLYECYWVCRTYLCILSVICDSLWCMIYLMIVLCRLNGGGSLTGLQPRSDRPCFSLLIACHAICITILNLFCHTHLYALHWF